MCTCKQIKGVDMFVATIADRFNDFTQTLSRETGLSEMIIILLIIVATFVVAKMMKRMVTRIIFVALSFASTSLGTYLTYMN